MLLNLCLLLTCAFLFSLTYREWPARDRLSDHALRLAVAAVASVLLVLNTESFGPLKIDLRYVPIAMLTLRYGLGGGALVALPVVVLRLLESEVGGVVNLLNTLSVLGLSALLRRNLRAPLYQPRPWYLPLPYLGVGLPLFFIPLPPGLSALPTYLLMLALHTGASWLVQLLLHTRLGLLRAQAELQRQVNTDDLTRLGNRHRFNQDLARLETGAQLVLLDVDGFRSLNERHGMAAGDRALRYIGQVMQDVSPDAAYRLSGEEFALLLNVGGEAAARTLVERIQGRLAEPGELPWSGLTLSAGLVTRLLHESSGELMHRADEALYLAKTNGRNRVVVGLFRQGRPATQTSESPPDIRPRYSLWQSQRTTMRLLSERRALTDADWQDLLRLAVITVEGVEAASLNIREGKRFRVCAVDGYPDGLRGTFLSEQSQLNWYGRGAQAWLAGQPRAVRGAELQQVWQAANGGAAEGHIHTFERLGRRERLRVNLCVPVLLGGEVIAHLNLDSFTSDSVFTPQVIEDAATFAQQVAALLQLQERWRELDQLALLHGDLSRSLTDEEIASHLTDTAHDLMRTSYSILLRYDPATDMLVSAARAGINADWDALPVDLKRGHGVSWQAVQSGQIIRVADLMDAPAAYRPPHLDDSRRALMAVPLLSRQQEPLGVLCLLRPLHWPFQASDEALASMLASVGTRVMERSAHLTDLRATLEASLNTLGVALEARDFETQGHTARVQDLALRMAEALNLPEEERTALRHGAALHDIGKLCIPDAVLLKPGRLSPEERVVVEQHAPLGAELVARIPFLHPQAHQVVRHHHERWDGAGYPDRLAGEQIPLLARIFALCDVYDALTSARPYKAAMPHEQATVIILDGAGTQFDPFLTDVFVRVLDHPDQLAQSPVSGRAHP